MSFRRHLNQLLRSDWTIRHRRVFSCEVTWRISLDRQISSLSFWPPRGILSVAITNWVQLWHESVNLIEPLYKQLILTERLKFKLINITFCRHIPIFQNIYIYIYKQTKSSELSIFCKIWDQYIDQYGQPPYTNV